MGMFSLNDFLMKQEKLISTQLLNVQHYIGGLCRLYVLVTATTRSYNPYNHVESGRLATPSGLA